MDALRDWEAAKVFLSDGLGFSRSILHVHLGLALFIGFTLMLRRPRGDLLPLFLVLLLESGNELVDFTRFQVSGWPWTPWPTVRDYIDTLLWPTVLTLTGRYRRPAPPAERPAEPAEA